MQSVKELMEILGDRGIEVHKFQNNQQNLGKTPLLVLSEALAKAGLFVIGKP